MTAAAERERLDAHVAALVAASPPLSESQRQKLAVLLRPAPVPRR